MSVRVYQYGLLGPSPEHRALIERELRAGHVFRNESLEIVRKEREALRRAQIEKDPSITGLLEQVSRLDQQIRQACAELKQKRAAERKRVDDEDLREAIARLRVLKKDTVSTLLKASSAAQKQIKTTVMGIHEGKLQQDREAYGKKGCYWPTADSHRAAVRQACDSIGGVYNWDGVPEDPRFRRWNGCGQIGGQIQKARRLESQVQIDWADQKDRVLTDRRRGPNDDGMRRKLSELKLRIGSDENRDPVWVSWPMIAHRPLPDKAEIRVVTVNRKMIGRRERWTAQITVEVPEVTSTLGGVVAIDLGWKVIRDPLRPHMGDRIRIAYFVGVSDDGTEERGELALDERAVGKIRLPNVLRSRRDQSLDAIKEKLSAWIHGRQVPEWVSEDLSTLHQWRSARRLASFCYKWKDSRFDGDDEGFDMLEAWRYHDQHLWDWEANQRQRGLLHRRELARILGAKLAQKYKTVIFPNIDLVRETPEVDEDGDNQASRGNAAVAAPAETRGAIANAFITRGGKVMTCDVANMSTDCHKCGHRNKIVELQTVCTGCGVAWDADRNLAMNMLRAAALQDGRVAARKPKKRNKNAIEGEKRFDRVRRQRAERLKELAAARDPAATAAE